MPSNIAAATSMLNTRLRMDLLIVITSMMLNTRLRMDLLIVITSMYRFISF